MKFIANIVAAEEEELVSVGESSNPLDEWSAIEWPGLDTDKFVMLHCLFTGESLGTVFALYEPVYVADAGGFVLRIAGAVQERLAALGEAAAEEALQSFAEELAATEAFEVDAWTVIHVQAMLVDLAELAQLAESQGQVLFVCMRPLPE